MRNPGTPLDELSVHALDGQKIVTEASLSGGYSTSNVLLRTDTGDRFVLRRYVRQNTCAVEAALLQLVGERVPVPEAVYVDDQGALLGEPLLLTRFVPGVPANVVFTGAADEDGPALATVIGQALADIASFTFPKRGFFSDGDLRTDAKVPEHVDDVAAFVAACLEHPNAQAALSVQERQDLIGLAKDSGPLVEQAQAGRSLVHSDYNPKNILLRPCGDSWAIAAVLDWEYAFVGHPLFDLGNMLRFPNDLPAGFAEQFPRAYASAGGSLPHDWEQISQALDLFALADLLTRAADHPLKPRTVDAVRERLSIRPVR